MIRFSNIKTLCIQFLAMGMLCVFCIQVLDSHIMDMEDLQELVDFDLDDSEEEQEDIEADKMQQIIAVNMSDRLHSLLQLSKLHFTSTYDTPPFSIEIPPPDLV